MKMADIELKNETELEFTDISSEKWREYHYRHTTIRIENPQWLAITEKGHRILDGNEVSHYIRNGWKQIKWEGNPHFVK